MPLYEFQCSSCCQTIKFNITPKTARASDVLFCVRNLKESPIKLNGEEAVEVEVEKVALGCSGNDGREHFPNYQTVTEVS